MVEKSFQERCRVVMRRGDLTITDLRWWFDRHRATVQAWVLYGHEPTGPAGREAYKALARLEAAIERGRSFPVPANLSWGGRRAYMQKVRPGGCGEAKGTAA